MRKVTNVTLNETLPVVFHFTRPKAQANMDSLSAQTSFLQESFGSTPRKRYHRNGSPVKDTEPEQRAFDCAKHPQQGYVLEKSMKQNRAHTLPLELWALIVADDTIGLPPRWRFAARPVCRAWRDAIDVATPSVRGVCKSTIQAVCGSHWSHEWQAQWATGRIVTARAVVQWAQRDPERWAHADAWSAWFKGGTNALPPGHWAAVLAATGLDMAVERAIAIADNEYATLVRIVGHGHTSDAQTDPLGDDARIAKRWDKHVGTHTSIPPPNEWPTARISAKVSPCLVALAAIASGSHKAVTAVAAMAPRSMATCAAWMLAIDLDNIGVFLTIKSLFCRFGLAFPRPHTLLANAIEKGASRILACLLDAGESWPACNADSAPGPVADTDHPDVLGNRNDGDAQGQGEGAITFGPVIYVGRGSYSFYAGHNDPGIRDQLFQLALQEGSHEVIDIVAAHGFGADLSLDDAVTAVCTHRSMVGARWLLTSGTHWIDLAGGVPALVRLLVDGAIRVDGDGMDMDRISSQPDGLLAWLFEEGPSLFGPLLPILSANASAGSSETERHPSLHEAQWSDVVPRLVKCAPEDHPVCALWLCERFPEALVAGGRSSRPLIDSLVLNVCREQWGDPCMGEHLERLVILLDTLAASKHGRDAVGLNSDDPIDLWPVIAPSATETITRSVTAHQVAKPWHHALVRYANDTDIVERVRAGLRAHERYGALSEPWPRLRAPFWAPTDSWARWCRVPPAVLSAYRR